MMKLWNAAIADVVNERQRQIEAEGWTDEHDDKHGVGELSAAGMCYAGHACLTLRGQGGDTVPTPWPWANEWWKPKNPRRDLVRAAALLIAEIERLDRAASKTPNVEHNRRELASVRVDGPVGPVAEE